MEEAVGYLVCSYLHLEISYLTFIESICDMFFTQCKWWKKRLNEGVRHCKEEPKEKAKVQKI